MKSAALGLAALIAASLPHACLANDLPATEQFSGTTVEFKFDKLFGVVTLTVAGPNGLNASASARSVSPMFVRATATLGWSEPSEASHISSAWR